MEENFNNNGNGTQINTPSNNGTVQININPKKDIKLNITFPENLISRDEMLGKLEAEFESHKCVVISGMGGSGKTSLAYLYAKKHKFNNIVWITINGKIIDAFFDKMAGALFEGENLDKFTQNTNEQAKLDKINSVLSGFTGENLMVFDINTHDEETKLDLEKQIHKYLPAGEWKTLILTRTLPKNKTRFTRIPMDRLTENDAKKLFENNYDGEVELLDEHLATIVEKLYYHPLLIEQTALFLSDGDEQSPEELIKKIEDNNPINNDITQSNLSGLAAEGKEEQDIYSYLKNLCNIKTLSDEEKNFLAVYVTWPTEPINKETIDTLMPGYKSTLKKLNKKGILSRNSADQFIIHSLLADVLREQIEIEKHDYTEYFGNIEKELYYDETKRMLMHKYSKCIASSFINYGICKDKDIVLFRDFLTNMRNHGDPILYNLPEPKYSDMIKELANNAEPYQAAELYNAAARVEEVRYHLQEAKSLYEKGLEVMKGLEGSPDNLYLKGALLNNLAILEEDLNDLDAAKEHLKKAIEIMRNLPESPENLDYMADWLTGLGMLDAQLGDINSVKEHYKEALEIAKQIQNEEYIEYLEGELSQLPS